MNVSRARAWLAAGLPAWLAALLPRTQQTQRAMGAGKGWRGMSRGAALRYAAVLYPSTPFQVMGAKCPFGALQAENRALGRREGKGCFGLPEEGLNPRRRTENVVTRIFLPLLASHPPYEMGDLRSSPVHLIFYTMFYQNLTVILTVKRNTSHFPIRWGKEASPMLFFPPNL